MKTTLTNIALLLFIYFSSFAQTNEFVSLKENKFYLNCEEYYPVVINYTVQVWQEYSIRTHFI